jgi:hypothetical protein
MRAVMVSRRGEVGRGACPLPAQITYPMIPAGKAAREMVG